MALIIITVELSIDSLHTIVGNPQKQYITKKTGTCFWRAHLQSLGEQSINVSNLGRLTKSRIKPL